MSNITKLPKTWTIKFPNGNIDKYYIKDNEVYYDCYFKFVNLWQYNVNSLYSINEYIEGLNKFGDNKNSSWYFYKKSVILALKEEEFNKFIKGL